MLLCCLRHQEIKHKSEIYSEKVKLGKFSTKIRGFETGGNASLSQWCWSPLCVCVCVCVCVFEYNLFQGKHTTAKTRRAQDFTMNSTLNRLTVTCNTIATFA